MNMFFSVPPPPAQRKEDADRLERLLRDKTDLIEWSEFSTIVPTARIRRVVFAADLDTALVEANRQTYVVSVHESLRSWLLTELLDKKVPYRILPARDRPWSPLWGLFSMAISIGVSVLITQSVLAHLLPTANRPASPPSVTYRLYRPNVSETWIGSLEVLSECIDSLENTRGLLLEGDPGTGKTLLARKLAFEANVSFLPVVGSQFVEVYVGLGAQRVRQLFAFARRHAPIIVFIDEVDSIAAHRGGPHSHSESDHTLNQLLAEMDGFRDDSSVFVLGATNRVDTMDAALLRPGRFDRVVHIPLPDKKSRKKMFAHYLQKSRIPVATTMDLDTLATLSDGFSGAVIHRVVREAVVFAQRYDDQVLEERHLDLALEKEWVGLLKTEEDRSLPEIERVAVHESGHALLAHHYGLRVRKISVRANHRGMGGFTLYDDLERNLPTRASLENRLAVLLGGRAAESLRYGRDGVSAGAVHDLVSVNRLAETMVTELGFSDRFPSLAPRSMAWSGDIRDALHGEIQALLDRSLERALKVLNGTKAAMEALVDELVLRKSVNETRFLFLVQKSLIDATAARIPSEGRTTQRVKESTVGTQHGKN